MSKDHDIIISKYVNEFSVSCSNKFNLYSKLPSEARVFWDNHINTLYMYVQKAYNVTSGLEEKFLAQNDDDA